MDKCLIPRILTTKEAEILRITALAAGYGLSFGLIKGTDDGEFSYYGLDISMNGKILCRWKDISMTKNVTYEELMEYLTKIIENELQESTMEVQTRDS